MKTQAIPICSACRHVLSAFGEAVNWETWQNPGLTLFSEFLSPETLHREERKSPLPGVPCCLGEGSDGVPVPKVHTGEGTGRARTPLQAAALLPLSRDYWA